MAFDPLTSIAHTIQLAIAPVFLIAGLANLLAVMTNRLARVVDRARNLVREHNNDLEQVPEHVHEELEVLDGRMRHINRAVTWSTLALLLVCLVIGALFAGQVTKIDISVAIISLFMLVMAALIIALSSFLAEVRLATRMLRIPPNMLRSKQP